MAPIFERISTTSNSLMASWRRQSAMILLILALEIVLAYQVAQIDPFYIAFLLVLMLVLVCVFFSLENAVLLLFVYMAFDGFIKNVTSYNTGFHIAKDVFLILIFLVYLLSRIMKNESIFPKTPANIPIIAFVIICLLQFFNPATHPVIALSGIKTHLLPIVLLPIAFFLFVNKQQIMRFMTVLVILGTIVALYSFVQYAQGPERVASMGPGFARVVYDRAALWKSPETSAINFRPFSTAQDCGAAAMYYLITIPLALACLFSGESLGRKKFFLIGATAILFLALVISGVRSAWFATVIGLLFFGVLSKKARSLFVVLIVGAIAIYVGTFLSGGGIMERILMSSNPWQAFMETRGMNITTYLVWAIYAYPFGRGLGRAGPGEVVFAKWFPEEAGTFVGSDNYLLVMVYEAGILGALAILWIKLTILFNGYKIYNQIEDKEMKWIMAGILAMFVAMLSTWLAGPTLISNPAGYYFWFLSGMLLKLGHIAVSESHLTGTSKELNTG